MLFNGVEGAFNLRDVVYVVEDNTVGIDDVVDSTISANRDSGDGVPQQDKFGVYVTNRDLFPDMWWVVPLSIIILRDLDRRDEHGIVFITQATTLLNVEMLQ